MKSARWVGVVLGVAWLGSHFASCGCEDEPVPQSNQDGGGVVFVDAGGMDLTGVDRSGQDLVGQDAGGRDRLVGVPDANNPDNDQVDSDCDGLSDAEEFGNIYAGGARTDPAGNDSDGDGIPDGTEVGRTSSPDPRCVELFVADADPTTTTDPTRADSDGDGLCDGNRTVAGICTAGEDLDGNGRVDSGETDPRNPDTDGDGQCDGSNAVSPVCTCCDPDPLDPIQDSDNDGVPNAVEEASSCLDPNDPDSDGDGLCDGDADVAGLCVAGEDANGDGLVNSGETDPCRVDTDCDGVSDRDERDLGLNPLRADSDGDLIRDGVELCRTQNLDPVHCTGFVGAGSGCAGSDPLSADSDGDGLNDGLEDVDWDGVFDSGETDPGSADTDGDQLCDGPARTIAGCHDGEDLNANGSVDFGETDPRVPNTGTSTTPDPNDPNNPTKDSDCDGLSDAEEFGNVYAGGRTTDPANPDSDGDGILDGVEIGRTSSVDSRCAPFSGDADAASRTDPTDADSDNDGLCDGDNAVASVCDRGEDLNHNGRVDPGETDPRNPDTDHDGLCDGPNDVLPVCTGGDPNPTGDGSGLDSDGDGVPDSVESASACLAVNDPDTDNDGLCDGPADVAGTCVNGEDYNGDGVVNAGETDPCHVDTDCDGVSDKDERDLGLNPRKKDSDGDMISDGVELCRAQNLDQSFCTSFIAAGAGCTGSDPLAVDSDGDGINDGVEDADRDGVFETGETDPKDGDTDGDGLCDGPVRMIPTVCSGGEDLNANGHVDQGETDPLTPNNAPTDTDRDGIPDSVEALIACLDGNDPDTDGDGLCDGGLAIAGVCARGEDLNNNGRVDTNETDPCLADTDCDGLADGASYSAGGTDYLGEQSLGTSPINPDSDGDGLDDGLEAGVTAATAPAGTDASCGFVADADPATTTDPADADSDDDGVVDGAEDADQDGQVDTGELDPNDNTDVTTTVTNACAQPLAPVLHGQSLTDLLLATAPAFANARTSAITNGAGDNVGLSLVDNSNNLAAFAVRKAPEGADPAAEVNAIVARIGNITVPLMQTFTTWDGFPAARGTYTFGDTQSITDRTTRAVRQTLADAGATVTLTGAPAVSGPFKLGLEVVRRSTTTSIVVGVLQGLAAYQASDYRHDDVINGSALAQVGDTVGLQCDRFDSTASQKVDFIWVIDDSGSMDDAQNAVAAAADAMIAQLNNSTLDWRIAIVTTYYSYASTENNLWTTSGGHYCPFQTTTAGFLQCLGNVVASGRGTERGFQSLDEALDDRFLPAQAGTASRIRPDARVVAIFLTDAGDQSTTQNVTTWTNYFQGGAGTNTWDPNRSDEEAMILGGILCPVGIHCTGETDSTGTGSEVEQYYQVIQNLGGVYGSIAQPNGSGSASDADIQATIQGIMNTVIGLAAPYELTKAPISATLKVALEGPVSNPAGCNLADVPRSRQDGFSYDGASRALSFHGACRPTTIGTEVVASYYYWTDRTGEPNGSPGCDCTPPEVCDELTLECYCPPDCGVGTVPPQQVCDTASCTLVCRPDCGAGCTGNSVCNSDPAVCACECPADCGGTPPTGNFVCDRDPMSPTFCQYICLQCPGTPTNPTMICDPLTCRWTCPACGNCPGLATCSDITCACECMQTLTCAPGYLWDDVACDCVCNTAMLGCASPFVADANLCACVCPADCGGVCGSYECNVSTCECACPADCGVANIPPEQMCNTTTCQLECRPDCGATCTGNSVCNPAPGVCACECPSDCGGAPPSANFTCDRTPGSPTYCEWVCTECPLPRPNDLMTCNLSTCTWQCPPCGDCPGIAQCSPTTCVCECTSTLTCGPGYRWDQVACDCVCDTDALDCDPAYEADAELCACVCKPNCGETCDSTMYCNQSLCLCLPLGG
ncbi:MAG: hypothetical protein JXR83_16150 [Deltaproteobacteria bacterium]|nr:hypothetical protein [Deltaproteobacteria bacterium]